MYVYSVRAYFIVSEMVSTAWALDFHLSVGEPTTRSRRLRILVSRAEPSLLWAASSSQAVTYSFSRLRLNFITVMSDQLLLVYLLLGNLHHVVHLGRLNLVSGVPINK